MKWWAVQFRDYCVGSMGKRQGAGETAALIGKGNFAPSPHQQGRDEWTPPQTITGEATVMTDIVERLLNHGLCTEDPTKYGKMMSVAERLEIAAEIERLREQLSEKCGDCCGCPQADHDILHSLIAEKNTELERLRAERDAAYARGWEAAKEKAAEVAGNLVWGRDVEWWLTATKKEVSEFSAQQCVAAIKAMEKTDER